MISETHLNVRRLPQHHRDQLDVAGQFLDLIEVGDYRDGDKLVGVHL